MRTIILILSLNLSLIFPSVGQQLTSSNDSLSYTLGVLFGQSLAEGGYGNINMDIFVAALRSSMKKELTLMSPEACEQYIQKGAAEMKMKQYEPNRVAGEEFLAKNKTRNGVVTLPSGLQYEILRAGDGPKPKATDEVNVHYHGTLPNGQIFDSSVDRGETISFPLNRVISGWTEVLQLMPVGSKWRVYIPHQLAYGDRPAGPHIQPFSALIFEIELFGIK